MGHPALTGAVAVLASIAGEMQRPGSQLTGIAERTTGLAETSGTLVDALT